MKKLVLLLALGVAGMMSANALEVFPKISMIESNNIQNLDVLNVGSFKNSEQLEVLAACYPVTYLLSCGKSIQDTHCSDFDAIECDLSVIWDLWNTELC
ncbi:hypothetical protein Q73A0000_14255 [Kaistella flava (ex Peng et al. 2021)]|uniref:Uncharacterized protein n=1 Tax=Kaistella flava (ex Peng et al. 2021) TaxID=2038776 RepID=A0A7M2YCT8_9FLAO|nr:hypothetical protein [Kaistella flava (ex Peng et al. 2021)]QOW11444.1 hypothetical protein Q73A0000_14255 [Kaistella flava (ex Peng et al. 2021)]